MPPKIKLAIETTIVDKIVDRNSQLWRVATTGFQNVELSPHEIADHINRGHPFCAQHQGRRSQANFIGSDVLAVDIDDGMQLDEALSNPYVQQHAALLYTTPSHTEKNNRFRIVFQTPRTITDAAEMRAAYTGLIRKFGGDKSCNDACRLFFGSKDSNPTVFGNMLSEDALNELLTLGAEPRVSDSSGDKQSHGDVTVRRSGRQLAEDQMVTMTNGRELPLAQMYELASIFCPVHIERRPSAFVVKNRYGFNGVHCRTCAATFWPPNSYPRKAKPVDFYQIEDFAREQEYLEDPYNHYDDDAPDGLIEMAQAERRYFTFADQFLNFDDTLFPGLTFIRSPKGSGKTEHLKKIVARSQKEDGPSILLIGHRQTLIKSMADRLRMDCYYETTATGIRNVLPTEYYAICVDSMGKLLEPKNHRYDVVVMDEAEQLIDHITGDTLKDKRRACLLKLFHYIRAAKSVIMLDADLGPNTFAAISEVMKGRESDYRLYVNSHKENRCPFFMYESDKHLLDDMLKTIQAGGHHYIATNSRKKADTLAVLIQKHCGETCKVLLITSITVKDTKVANIVREIKNEILNYNVVIASPTIGTGIDITFDNQESRIDSVFGFFEGRITTHFDIDQQLSRVRHPKEIRVWVSPLRFNFETEPSVIRNEILDSAALNDILLGFKPDGMPEHDEVYLNIYTQVTALSRASKNKLRQHFTELRRRNGWKVIEVAPDVDAMKATNAKLQVAKAEVEAQYAAELCGAEKIDANQYNELKEASRKGLPMKDGYLISMRRYEIESFYRTEISPEIVDLDDHGSYRKKVKQMLLHMLPVHTIKENAIRAGDHEKLITDREQGLLKKILLHQLLEAAGVINAYGDFDTTLQLCNANLGEFAQLCKQQASKIQELFNIPVRKDVLRKPMQQLTRMLDLIGLTKTEAEKKKAEGVTTYLYRIDEGSLITMKEIIERRAAPGDRVLPDIEFLTKSEHAKKRAKERDKDARRKST